MSKISDEIDALDSWIEARSRIQHRIRRRLILCLVAFLILISATFYLISRPSVSPGIERNHAVGTVPG